MNTRQDTGHGLKTTMVECREYDIIKHGMAL